MLASVSVGHIDSEQTRDNLQLWGVPYDRVDPTGKLFNTGSDGCDGDNEVN